MLEKAISGRKVKSGGKCRAVKTKIQLQLEIVDEVEKLLNYLICNTHTDTHTPWKRKQKGSKAHTQTKVQAAVVKICTKQINLHNTETFTNTNTQRETEREGQRQHTCLVGRNKAVPKIVSRCAMTERKPQIVFYIFDTILIFLNIFSHFIFCLHKYFPSRGNSVNRKQKETPPNFTHLFFEGFSLLQVENFLFLENLT